MSRSLKKLAVAFACMGLVAMFAFTAPAAEPVKVFILAGQSNMEGKAKMSLVEYQASAPETAPLFAHWKTEDGQWRERDDVWIKFLDRHGQLTVGYGSPDCVGPELEFGHTVGEHYDAPVLIIKTAWGGKSLFRDFRPPSAGLPSEDTLAQMLEQARERQPETTLEDVKSQFGAFYGQMIEEVRGTLADLPELFPQYEGQGYELSGFVWFQGWNDMINDQYTAEYTQNMIHFIRDIRRDLEAPRLPFVIGQLGVDGTQPEQANPARDAFKAAQAKAAELPEFTGNVAVVRTDQFWDNEADAVYRKGWRENLEEWNTVGSDYPYHYLGSVKCYSRIGREFAEAVIEMEK